MDIFLNVIILVLGFVMLVKGADYFVDGAAGISGKLKVPELVIGLTVVAFGTSAPELSVSISSAIKGSAELTIGNVIGSNIVNIILILGVSSLVRPLPVSKSSLKFDLPFLLFSSALFVIFGAIGNEIGRAEGIIMFLLLIAYIAFLVVTALKDRKKTLELGIEVEEEEEAPKGRIGEWYKRMCEKTWFLIIITVVGLAFVIVGADFVVDSSTFIAEKLNIDKRIIGLTVVAVGTSLPELVTSVTAAAKGKTDIAVGNIIGSNIFNILCVAGLSSAIIPLSFSDAFVTDGLIALACAALLAVLSYLPGHKIKRWGGAIMIAAFAGYCVYLFV